MSLTPEQKAPPAIVGKRNHFTPLEEIVDYTLEGADLEHNVLSKAALRKWGLQIAERVSHACEHAFRVGAERGITQARHLIQDPMYYDTIKNRRKRAALAHDEYERKQQIERMEQHHDPEFRARHISRLREWIDDNRKQAERLEQQLTAYLEFAKTPPKLLRMQIPEKAARLPGEPQPPGTPERVK